MAPSPTGPLHIGTARTTLVNWLFARHMGGKFVLRIEDTDKERSKKEYEDELLEGLTWLGFDWDEGPLLGGGEKGDFGPYRQSERTDIYRKYLEKLLANGSAYYCYCTKEDLEAQKQAMTAAGLPPKYNGHCRDLKEPPAGKKPEVIRFKLPEVKVEFNDMVRGKVVFDAGLFGDQVIAKDVNSPLYNFAVVVDDALMEITHVIRGEEHLSNTPKQILMARALGFAEPTFAHLPLILNPDRSKMSKRFADTALSEYRKKGYLPEAIMNFIALMGWHPKDDREVMTREELTALFDIERVQKAGAVFNQEKLDWLNREYLKKMSDDEIAEQLVSFFNAAGIAIDKEKFVAVVAAVRGRANTLADFVESGRFFFALPEYDTDLLVWKKKPAPLPQVASVLEDVRNALQAVPANQFKREELVNAITVPLQNRERGEVLWPLRVALSGQASSPDPMDIMGVLGKEESLRRVDIAIAKCKT